MANKAELLVQHYQDTYQLTYQLWQQRNRLFLILLGVVALASLLTYAPQTNSILLSWLGKVVGIKNQAKLGEQKKTIDEASLKAGKSMEKLKNVTEKIDSLLGAVKYDLVAEIAKETKLTRKTIVSILQKLKPNTFHNFKVNPENFIEEASSIINSEKAATLINNIIYSKTEKTYDDEIFTINNFKGSLSENILEVKRHVYDYLKTDAKTERAFAKDLESGEVLVYAKLPNDFKIPTPVGNYNPDWAIVFDTETFKYVYFIAETKGSMESLQLREIEKRKIDYAKKHFDSLGHADIRYDVITTYQDLKDKVMQ